MSFLNDLLAEHADHPWSQVGPCVYCDDCGTRLYQGELPEDRRTIPKCPDDAHDWDNGDSMSQCGFYLLCLRCGVKEWT